jgi:hypothetical protein
MKTVRFYDMVIDCIENGVETTRQLENELRLELPQDFDLNEAFDMLNQQTGCDVFSFRYENIA